VVSVFPTLAGLKMKKIPTNSTQQGNRNGLNLQKAISYSACLDFRKSPKKDCPPHQVNCKRQA
jgi:hypothetical protein